MLRLIRKHRIALIALGVYHFVFFFPTLFMQRVVSPNDVYFNFAPWSEVRSVDVQNPQLNDPPTSYFTLMALFKNDKRAFHWNPYIAGGVPGFGSAASAMFTPFALLPALLLPLSWVYSGMIFLKLNAAFLFAYLWLREERLGKGAAAAGAIVFAAAGPIAVRWLWQTTNAVALYPALLWIVRRTASRKRTPFWIIVLVALAYALSGFPAAMAYGAYVATAYLVFLLIRRRQLPARRLSVVTVAVALAVLMAMPALVPFVRFVRSTGYLELRTKSSLDYAFPLRHFAGFIWPDRLGNPADHSLNWNGDRELGLLNNYIEATVYVGLLALPLALIGLAARRARSRWFWLAALAVLLACMFGFRPLTYVVGELPGFKYSALTRLQAVMPLPFAYLAAAGVCLLARRRETLVGSAVVVLAAADLALFAGRFYPYLDWNSATPPATPVISFLQAESKPFRIAPFFIYLWPNTSELVRLEDVRSHFSSEARYRALLRRIDPGVSASRSTILQFDSRSFDFADPLASMLGIRYFLENRDIDIIKWTTFKNTAPGVKETGGLAIPPGAVLQRHVVIDAMPFYAIELPFAVDQVVSKRPRTIVTLLHGSEVLFQRAFTPEDMAGVGKVYVPVYPRGQKGDTLLLRIQAVGMRVGALRGATNVPGDAPLFYGRVFTPVVFDRLLPDGRLFRNIAEVPRFHAVSRLRIMDDATFLAAKNIDFAREAVVTDPSAVSISGASDAAVTLRSYAADEQRIDVSAPAPTFLASSEKLTPELKVTIDGRRATPVEINMRFAGVAVPAGTHHVVFSRRIGGGWWWLSAASLLIAAALSVIDAWPRRRSDTRTARARSASPASGVVRPRAAETPAHAER